MTKNRLLQIVLGAAALAPPTASAEDAPATGSTAVVTTDAPTEAKKSEDAPPPWPVTANVSVSYKFNHANFTPTESDQADFGTQQASVGVGASYAFLEKFSVDLALNAGKELSKSFYGANSSKTSIRGTDFGDSSLSVGGELWTIPVADISVSASLGASIPTSKASQAAKIYTTVSPGVSLGWKWERLTLGAGFDAEYTFAKYRTIHIEEDTAARNAEQSGADTGDPLGLWSLSESFSLGVKILDSLSFSAGYSISHDLLATEGKDDEYTAEVAETGNQWSMPSHGTNFGLRWSFLEKTSLSVGMSTRQSMYNKRGNERTVPLFDWETDTHERTKYSLGLAQAF